jgi:DNA uptake protein ComE-like DNA-binding protein
MAGQEPPAGVPTSAAAAETGIPTPPTPIDINTATAAEFATLEGFDPVRIARVEQTRQMLGGFVSTAQFATVAELAPHEYARIRNRITCGPRPEISTPGDNQQVPPHQGRILDV